MPHPIDLSFAGIPNVPGFAILNRDALPWCNNLFLTQEDAMAYLKRYWGERGIPEGFAISPAHYELKLG